MYYFFKIIFFWFTNAIRSYDACEGLLELVSQSISIQNVFNWDAYFKTDITMKHVLNSRNESRRITQMLLDIEEDRIREIFLLRTFVVHSLDAIPKRLFGHALLGAFESYHTEGTLARIIFRKYCYHLLLLITVCETVVVIVLGNHFNYDEFTHFYILFYILFFFLSFLKLRF